MLSGIVASGGSVHSRMTTESVTSLVVRMAMESAVCGGGGGGGGGGRKGGRHNDVCQLPLEVHTQYVIVVLHTHFQ